MNLFVRLFVPVGAIMAAMGYVSEKMVDVSPESTIPAKR
jgi:hypothetical protein